MGEEPAQSEPIHASAAQMIKGYAEQAKLDEWTGEEWEREQTKRQNFLAIIHGSPSNAVVESFRYLIRDDVPPITQRAGAESGVQWMYGALVDEMHRRIASGGLTLAEVQVDLGEQLWDTVKDSFIDRKNK
ncbi:MAG: hypothetical protein AAB557_05170 [Patescibacteria group bacterium]